MVHDLYHYIGGARVDWTSGRFGDVYNPCTGEVQARLPLASRDEVREAIANAEKGQAEWAASGLQMTLPSWLSFGPHWLLPALEIALLGALIVSSPGRL